MRNTRQQIDIRKPRQYKHDGTTRCSLQADSSKQPGGDKVQYEEVVPAHASMVICLAPTIVIEQDGKQGGLE